MGASAMFRLGQLASQSAWTQHMGTCTCLLLSAAWQGMAQGRVSRLAAAKRDAVRRGDGEGGGNTLGGRWRNASRRARPFPTRPARARANTARHGTGLPSLIHSSLACLPAAGPQGRQGCDGPPMGARGCPGRPAGGAPHWGGKAGRLGGGTGTAGCWGIAHVFLDGERGTSYVENVRRYKQQGIGRDAMYRHATWTDGATAGKPFGSGATLCCGSAVAPPTRLGPGRRSTLKSTRTRSCMRMRGYRSMTAAGGFHAAHLCGQEPGQRLDTCNSLLAWPTNGQPPFPPAKPRNATRTSDRLRSEVQNCRPMCNVHELLDRLRRSPVGFRRRGVAA